MTNVRPGLSPSYSMKDYQPIQICYYSGRSLYADVNKGVFRLTVAPDMTIYCLYERGEKFYSEKLTLARFNIEWLTDGTDKLQPKI